MRATVIGAGASGVCSALLLARYGHQVTLLEAGNALSPLLRGFTRQNLHFDTGFHQSGGLEENGILRRYLKFLGLLQDLEFTPFKKDCCELFRFVGADRSENVCLPQGLDDIGTKLSALWPEYADFIKDFFLDIRAAFFHSPFIDPRRMSMESLGLPTGSPVKARLGNLPPRLKTLLCGKACYYGTPPEQGLFNELALVSYSMLEGVHGIVGGGAALTKAFTKALDKAGVEFLPNSPVSSIQLGQQGQVTSVLTADGRAVNCGNCIFTGHPAQLPGLLPPGTLRPAKIRQLSGLKETHKIFMLFGATQSDFLTGRNLFLCFNDDIDAIYRDPELEKSCLHLSCGSPGPGGLYPVMAGAGISARALAARPDTPGGRQEWRQEFGAEMLELIQRYVPELADLRILDSADDQTLAKWIYGGTGSIYGMQHGIANFPVLPFTRIKNLFLAGQNIILPGLLGAFISGAVACGSIIGFKQLFKDLECTNAE